MKIALMMENSQANKNAIILNELNAVADEKGFPVYNVGMSDENAHHLTYIHLGIMASILLNSKAVDFVVTGCGTGQSVMGPFYCPADSTVYIDLSFYDEMKNKLGADGDFAQGYVIAHEVGHHVQKLLGIEPKVRQQQQHATQAEANRLSVKMELQADCFAGVWGHNMQQQDILETGDLQEALNAAEAIGDDRLQQQSQGRVVPDSFTHGTSKQRYTWFKRGFDSGDPAQCNTFGSAL